MLKKIFKSIILISYYFNSEHHSLFGGNYILCPGTEYTLSSNGWKVNNGEDGYIYGNDNDNGIVFYVQSKAEYSFGK